MDDVLKRIAQHKIVPVIAIENEKDVIPLADALIDGGLPLIEITYRTKIAAQAIKMISKERPEFLVGAGTVLTLDELHSAVDNGASFAVAPGFNRIIVAEARKLKFPFYPGIMTPSDLEGAMSMGVHVYKFFPAEAAGGIKMIKSLTAPYGHKNISFIPTGGINTGNLIEYLSIKEVAAIGGTWIAKSNDIEGGQWAEIADKCRQAVQLIAAEL